MKVDSTVFKAYDIRGQYPQQITPEMSYHLGRSVATLLSPIKVVIGRDMRPSSGATFQKLIQGILDSAVDVIDIGLVTTDTFYHACDHFSAPGVMVTASHNPPVYGGFKIVKQMPFMLGEGDGLEEIYDLICSESYVERSKTGILTQVDTSQMFVDKVISLINPETIKPMKIVADTGNGMAGPILQKTYANLPQINLIHINQEPDGISPSHGWDPLQPENHCDLQQKVLDERADLGFAFDGDGDRFFAIDNRGKFISGDFLTALLVQHQLAKSPNSKVVYDVRSSWVVPDQIKRYGGVPIQERVGHAFIKRRMSIEDAVFGGEITGHYYFKDFYFADSGILPSLFLVEILSSLGYSLSEALSEFENEYFISGEINTPVKEMSQVASKINQLEDIFSNDGKIEKLDGLSVIFDDWHFNVRPSNTEPLMRLNLEAKSKQLMEEKKEWILDILEG